MPEAVHLMVDKKQEAGAGDRILYYGAYPLPPHTRPHFLLHNTIKYGCVKESIHQPGQHPQDPSTFPNLISWQNIHLVQEMVRGPPHQNWNGRVLTDGQVDSWVCLYKWGNPPWLLRKLTLAHSKVIPIPAGEQPLGRRPVSW